MKFHSYWKSSSGARYISYKSENIATLRDRWHMLVLFWHASKPASWKIRIKAEWIAIKYVTNPFSHAYYYKRLEDAS